MQTDLKSAIRTALAKTSSQAPVEVTTLYKFGNKVSVMAAINALVSTREVNVAQVTKGDITTTLCWLTGVIEPAKSSWQLNQERLKNIRQLPAATLRTPGSDMSTPCAEVRKNVAEVQKTVTDVQESAAKVQPNTAKVLQTAVHQPEQKKETPMNAPANPHGGKQPGELNTAIYNKIVEHPGITRAALIKHAQQKCPDATEKQINKTILNLTHTSKKIRTEGERGNYTYHLNTGVSQPQTKPTAPAKPARKAAVGKVVTGKEAAELRGDPPPAETPAAHVEKDTKAPLSKSAAPALSDHQFTMMLSDDNYLHLGIDDEMYTLNPAQTARLHAFLHRVQLGSGAPA